MRLKLGRRHQSFTYETEKKLLDYLAARLYRFLNADQFSLLGLAGAVIAAIGYALAGNHLAWLLAASVGIFIQWFGDSLDGRAARLRGENKPLYGHYFDHILDAISTVIIAYGVYISDLTLTEPSKWVLI